MQFFEVSLFTIEDGREKRICKAYARAYNVPIMLDIITPKRVSVGAAGVPLYIRSTKEMGVEYSAEAKTIEAMDEAETPYFYTLRLFD